MYVRDFACMLDGLTPLRVNAMLDDQYVTVFDSDDWPSWVGEIPAEVSARYGVDVNDFVITEVGIVDDHILIKCEEE